MSLFKSLFSKKKESSARTLNQVEELQPGDFLQIGDSFVLPAQLRGQQLKVTEVNTSEYSDGHVPVWVLRGERGKPITLCLDDDDPELVHFSLSIERDQVARLFDLDAFAEVFEPGHSELALQQADDDLQPWVADHYWQRDDAVAGYFHRQDFRNSQPPQYDDQAHGSRFEYYSLYSEDGRKAVEIEVYEGGETDVTLTLLRPRSDIRDLYPGT